MTAEELLSVYATNLAQAAPRQWQEFLDAFKTYADSKRDECVRAPQDQIFAAQGRAQQCLVLHDLYSNCKAVTAKIKGRQRMP